MKKFIALMLLSSFAVASCYAAPAHSDGRCANFQYSKRCDLPAMELSTPVEFTLPAVANEVVQNPVVKSITVLSMVVVPRNKGPDRC